MSVDKRKPTLEPVHVESDKQFLDRSGASAQIKEVLTKILENRPEDPVIFLADFFESLGEKVDKVGKAHQQVCLTHYSKPAFNNNINIAYDILGQTKVSMTTDRRSKLMRKELGRHVRGINGSTYMEFLHLLCKGFHATIRDKLFKKIKVRDHEVVCFDVFRSAVFTCLVLKDYVEQCTALYKSLDSHSSGKVDRVLCETVTQQLHDAVTHTSSNSSSVLDAGYTLGPRKVSSTLTTALFRSGGEKKTMSEEDFVLAAADTFLVKVRSLR